MKLTSTDALRLEEIRKAQEEWQAMSIEDQVQTAPARAAFASGDVRVLLELIDRILPDCYSLTPEAMALLEEN